MNAERKMSAEERKSHLRNIAAMAFSDGEVSEPEMQLLYILAGEMGLSRFEVDELASGLDKVELVVPESEDARFAELYDLTEMMIIDGNLKRAEKMLCVAVAEKLGFPEEAIDEVVTGILEGNRIALQPELIREKTWRRLKERGLSSG